MAADVQGFNCRLLLSSSVLLNLSLLFFIYGRFHYSAEPPGLGWSRRCASQAEAVAAISCSGHGRAFLDGIPADGVEGHPPRCECNACYGGHDCSELLPDCPADVESGDAVFLEPYWRHHAAASAVLVAGWHRMSYQTNADDYLSVELERHIRLLHTAVGNAVTEGRFILLGTGSTQLINAAIHALSLDKSRRRPARVVASIPYYPLFKAQTNLFDSKDYEWRGGSSSWLNASGSSPADFIEIVTSPNNPECLLQEPILGGSSVVHDHAYYWPHYTAIPAAADGDVMLFSISKISGHAGSRFGWAVVKNESIYRRMAFYMRMNTIGVSRDTHLRILVIMKAILQGIRMGGEDDIFLFARRVLQERWRRLNNLVSASSGRFSLQKIAPQYCSYVKDIPDPSPAYGWLKCEMEEEEDCSAVLRSGGINGRAGSAFEADPRYARLSLIKSQDDVDLLLGRLEALVAPAAIEASWKQS